MGFRRYRFFVFTPLCVSVALLAAGCGKTGALYLPDGSRAQVPAQPETTPGASGSTPTAPTQAQERKRGTDRAPASDTQAPVSPPDPDRPGPSPAQPPDNR